MRVLIDSHALIWAVDDVTRLTQVAAVAMQDPANELLVSAASIWEMAIKVSVRKMTLSLPYRQWMDKVPILASAYYQSPWIMRKFVPVCLGITEIRLIACSLPRLK